MMRFTRMFASNRSSFTKLFVLLTGAYIGLTISNWLRGVYEFRASKICVSVRRTMTDYNIDVRPREISDELDTKRLLFVGIMTAEKFLDSRASVVYNTWGKDVPGKIAFFAGNESIGATHSLPVITLSGVDDRYPPQPKSFMMLKYMYDHFINDYEWFMRCDDDVYVRTDKLEELLRGFDSSEDLFIGQAGQGLQSERGKLGLAPNDNFCMGGPGMIMSRSVLIKLAPHLEYCLKHLVSSHEDVEVGRCIRKHVGVSCTWAFEMQWIFYHNQSKTTAFHWDLDTKAVQNAITLHPFKNPAYMYRIHSHFMEQKMLVVQQRSFVKSSTLRKLEKLTTSRVNKKESTNLASKRDLHRNVALNTTLHWEIFSPKKLYTVWSPITVPVDYSIKRSLNMVLRKTVADVNLEARKVIFRELLLSKVNLGYLRLSPTKGLQYLFDCRMVMYQNIGFSRRKLPINVQYQAHVQRSFGNFVYRSLDLDPSLPFVNVILPLAGRLEAFKRFLVNFEATVLARNEKVRMQIMYFPEVSSEVEHRSVLQKYTNKYSNFDVSWKTVKGDFSRGLALQHGIEQFSGDSLLFLCDVDLSFDVEFLNRCRANTVKRKQVYYPMVFSQFSPRLQTTHNLHKESVHSNGARESIYKNLQSDYGFWRRYGYGIVCAYAEDIRNVGGFDLNIKGWGLEDIRLYEQFLASGRYDVIRTPDPGLVHIYHASSCSEHLSSAQLRSCRNSALSQLANAGSLVDFMRDKGYL